MVYCVRFAACRSRRQRAPGGERGAAGPVGPRTLIAMGKVQMAQALLERGAVAPGLFPGEHIPTRMEEMS